MFVPMDIPKYSNVLMYLNEEHKNCYRNIYYKRISYLNVDIKIYYDEWNKN